MTATIKSSFKRRLKMEGLKLAARYSYVCEKARLFHFSDEMKDFFLSNRDDKEKIESILKHLVSYNFYQKIAHLNKKEVFDKDVVSFYWKGSPKIKGIQFIHNASTLIPIIQLKMRYIVEELVDDCVIHPAQIIKEYNNGDFLVKYQPIDKVANKLILADEAELLVRDDLKTCNLKTGDWITIHFKKIIEKISKEEADNLLKLTKEVLKSFNKQNAKKTC